MIGILIAAIFIILAILLIKKTQNKHLVASLLIGFGITAASFIALVLFLFLTQKVMMILLLIFYVSIIVFLVLWNKIRVKKVYLVLLIPLLCILSGFAIYKYQVYIYNIPILDDQNFYLGQYIPFNDNNKLAELDEESKLKISNNLPILDGATALYPVYAAFAQAVYPKDHYGWYGGAVQCNKTSQAYENLLNGTVDIIFCAQPSAEQQKQFIEKGVDLKLIPIGKEAFVFFVNKKNSINNLSIEEIKGIYSGKIKNWKQLNGKSEKIRAYQRPANSGSQTMLEKAMGSTPDHITIINAPRENVQANMGGMINQVAAYRNFSNAIGYSFLFFTTEMVKNDHIKLLSIDGIYPSEETIKNNTYPFCNNFYAIYADKKEKNANIDTFIEWMLSDQGQKLIKKTGYVPN